MHPVGLHCLLQTAVHAYVSEMNGREAVTVEIREMVFAGTEEDVLIGRLDFREVVFD